MNECPAHPNRFGSTDLGATWLSAIGWTKNEPSLDGAAGWGEEVFKPPSQRTSRRSEGSADFVTWTHMCEPFARQISTERVSGMINQAKAAPFAVHPHILARKVARRSVADLHSINKFWHDMPHNGIIREADEVVARDPGRVRRAAGSVLQEESRARIEGLTSPILLDPSEQLISNDRVSLPGAREFIAG